MFNTCTSQIVLKIATHYNILSVFFLCSNLSDLYSNFCLKIKRLTPNTSYIETFKTKAILFEFCLMQTRFVYLVSQAVVCTELLDNIGSFFQLKLPGFEDRLVQIFGALSTFPLSIKQSYLAIFYKILANEIYLARSRKIEVILQKLA